MASIVLGAAGSSLASGTLLGASAGGILGSRLGNVIDGALFGGSGVNREGPRLEELSVQTSTYGKTIPLLFGTARLAGNASWSLPIKEVAETTEVSVEQDELEAARWITRDEARQVLAGTHPDIYAPPPMAVAHHILKAWAERDS